MSQITSTGFFLSPLCILKDTAEIVRLKYLLDCIDSGLTSRENVLCCLGKKRARMPMDIYDF